MKLRVIALAGIALAAFAAPAAAGDGWYLGLGFGANQLDSFSATSVALGGTTNAHFNVGWNGLATAGYKLGEWRIEVEGDYAYNSAKSLRPGVAFASDHLTGNLTQPSVFGNVAWDIPIDDRFAFTVGAGAGVRGLQGNVFDTDSGDGFHGNQSRFAWQGIGGLIWAATPDIDLQLDYRYGQASHGSAVVNGITPAIIGQKTNQSLMLSFRWFVEDHTAEPAAMPPAPPPPPPPPPVKTFIVFFDFNQSSLTNEAQSVVSAAVKAARDNGWVKVMVTGHTDTVGSDKYNQALSERRANAVKTAMVSLGMSSDAITTQGKSFHDPLVPTGPGVREPQNRRAVIEY